MTMDELELNRRLESEERHLVKIKMKKESAKKESRVVRHYMIKDIDILLEMK